jgi:hypothetical protein
MTSRSRIYSDIAVLGVRVRFEATDISLLNFAIAQFPDSRGSNSAAGGQVVSVSLIVREAGFPAPVTSVEGPRLIIASDHIDSYADGLTGQGQCACRRDDIDSAEAGEAINTVVLFLVAHAGRIPIHASAFMLRDIAIVLAGRSGSGKSLLAYSANRRGFPILSDDTLYVQTEPHLRIWALPNAIHMLEKDAPCEPGGRMRLRSGRWKRALPIQRPSYSAESAILCVLARGDSVGVEPMHSDEAISVLTGSPEPGYEFYGHRPAAVIRALARSGCWKLTLSSDPDAAIDVLLDNLTRADP